MGYEMIFFLEEMIENKEILPNMWLEVHESITYEFWPSMNLKMQVVDVFRVWDVCAKLVDFNRKYSSYLSSVNLELRVSTLETLSVLEWKLYKEYQFPWMWPILLQYVPHLDLYVFLFHCLNFWTIELNFSNQTRGDCLRPYREQRWNLLTILDSPEQQTHKVASCKHLLQYGNNETC